MYFWFADTLWLADASSSCVITLNTKPEIDVEKKQLHCVDCSFLIVCDIQIRKTLNFVYKILIYNPTMDKFDGSNLNQIRVAAISIHYCKM